MQTMLQNPDRLARPSDAARRLADNLEVESVFVDGRFLLVMAVVVVDKARRLLSLRVGLA